MEDGALTNRELATLIWLTVGAALFLCLPGRRKRIEAAASLLATLATPKLLLPLIGYFVWLAGAVWIAGSVGLWDSSLSGPTVIWIPLSGLGLFFSFDKAMRQDGFFKSALLATVGASAFVEFFASFQSFPLLIELLAQPIVALMAVIAVVAKGEPGQQIVAKAAEWVVIGFGLVAIIWTAWSLVRSWDELDRAGAVTELLAPIWLTPAALVFVYGIAVYAAYDQAFSRIGWKVNGRSSWRQKAAYVSMAGLRLRRIRRLSGRVQLRAADAATFSQARQVIAAELSKGVR